MNARPHASASRLTPGAHTQIHNIVKGTFGRERTHYSERNLTCVAGPALAPLTNFIHYKYARDIKDRTLALLPSTSV
jgi:hypothetical protein